MGNLIYASAGGPKMTHEVIARFQRGAFWAILRGAPLFNLRSIQALPVLSHDGAGPAGDMG